MYIYLPFKSVFKTQSTLEFTDGLITPILVLSTVYPNLFEKMHSHMLFKLGLQVLLSLHPCPMFSCILQAPCHLK